jgi:hypothetical protein
VSDFSRPEYASYVALCRELKLAHKFERGDSVYYAAGTDPSSRESVTVWINCDEDSYPESAETDDMAIWLPSLSDWLEMLEAIRFGRVKFDNQRLAELGVLNPENLGPWSALGDRDDFRTAPANPNFVIAGAWAYGCGPTREEAAARLWMAVTKSLGK